MMTIGLTGGIGSGKTTVAKFFMELGIPVYFADSEAKKLMNESIGLKSKILSEFGDNSYRNGSLNRAYIAGIVFDNPQKLEQLNALVHPAVADDFKRWLKTLDAPYAIQENAIIFESNSFKKFDSIIAVTAPKKDRIKRVMDRDKITEEMVKMRMKNQWPEYKKIAASDYTIYNTDLEKSKRSVARIHRKLLAQLALNS